MKTFDLSQILETALQCRSVFHSESDFQHHLAWEIHKTFKDAEVRLEYPLPINQTKRRQRCDIFFKIRGVKIGVELKYKTKKLCTTIDQDTFNLTNQFALDNGRYDFFKDIARLESWVKSEKIDYGYAVFLTNDQAYWGNSQQATVDAKFKIYDSRIAEGRLAWSEKASEGTMKRRKDPITLHGTYTMNWRDSPNKALLESKELSNRFRYLCVQVPA